MKNLRKTSFKEKGITLVALVVTIIVLLILAGVTISIAINNNGLIDRTKTAKATYVHSSVYEEVQLTYINYQFLKINNKTNKSLIEYLQEKNIIGEQTSDGWYVINNVSLMGSQQAYGKGTNGKNDVYVLVESTSEEGTYDVKYLGNAVAENVYLGSIKDLDGAGQKLIDAIEIGDYVSYNITYTNQTSSPNPYDCVDFRLPLYEGIGTGWRVFSIDKNNDTIKLIPEGVPLLENASQSSINELLDRSVATSIKRMEFSDIQSTCSQLGFTVDYDNYYGYYGYYFNKSRDIDNLINNCDYCRIETTMTDQYGYSGKAWVSYDEYADNVVIKYSQGATWDVWNATLGIRPLVTLKSGIITTEGDGTKANPFNMLVN